MARLDFLRTDGPLVSASPASAHSVWGVGGARSALSREFAGGCLSVPALRQLRARGCFPSPGRCPFLSFSPGLLSFQVFSCFCLSADPQTPYPALFPEHCCFLSPRGAQPGGIWTQWCLLSRLARSAHYLPLSEEGRCWMSSIWWVA